MGSMNAMIEQQSALAKLQNQVALGTRVTTPADDPIAAVHILELQRAQSESEQFAKNSTLAKNRLSIEEQSMVDVGNALNRVRELMSMITEPCLAVPTVPSGADCATETTPAKILGEARSPGSA